MRGDLVRAYALAVACLVVCSCADGSNVPRDKAEGPLWRLVPTVRIDAQTAPEHPLYLVVAAFVLGDRLVIANAGSQQLLVFDLAGELISVLGGSGRGPGEYEGMLNAYPAQGDTALVWDWLSRRITWVSVKSGRARSVQLRSSLREPQLLGMTGGGWLLYSAAAPRDSVTISRAGKTWLPIDLYRFHPAVGSLEHIGLVPRLECIPSATSCVPHPLGRVATTLPFENGYLSADRVSGFAICPWDGVACDTTYIAGSIPVRRHDLRRLFPADSPIPLGQLEHHVDRMPPFGQLVLTEDSLIMLEQYGTVRETNHLRSHLDPSAEDSIHWHVVDHNGRLAARVRSPAGVLITHFGDSIAVGLVANRNGEEMVQLYRIVKRPAPPPDPSPGA